MTTPALPSRLVTLVRRKDRPACVMLPGAGGGLHPYLRLASYLGQTHNVYAVRAAGLLPGETPETTVAEMADSALAALAEKDIAPALVFGWSLGGTLGWELCLRLAAAGHQPDLVVVDSSPLRRPSTEAADTRILDVIVAMLGPRPEPETVRRVVDTFRAQVGALAGYDTVGGYAGRVLLLMCSDEDITGRDEAVARWRELAADIRVGALDAGHFEVFEQDRLPQLTGAIGDFLGPVPATAGGAP
jgi:thioesterase domain-containing protein